MFANIDYIRSHLPVAFNLPYLHLNFVISSHIPQPYIFHRIDIDHVETQRSFASCAMLMWLKKAEISAYGC